jgi:hypothetical protein
MKATPIRLLALLRGRRNEFRTQLRSTPAQCVNDAGSG